MATPPYPLNFDPQLRRVAPGSNAQPISAPMDIQAAPAPGERAPLSAAEQLAAFEREHPFAPAGSFTPVEPVTSSQTPGLYSSASGADRPVASSDPYAEERGAGEALAMQRMVMPGLYPASGFNGVAEVRNAARAASGSMYGMPAGGGGRRSSGGGDFGMEADASGLSPILTAALGLQQLKQEEVAGDTMANMASAGALLNPETDTPEIRSRKLQYMQKRLDDTAANALDPSQPLPRAPGTPMYTGSLQPGQAGRMELNGRTYAGGPGGIPSALDLARTSTEIPNLNGPVGGPPAPGPRPAGSRGLSVELAQTAQRLLAEGRQPRLRTLGKDSRGNVVEGVQDAQGNFSRISAPRDGQGTQLNQLYQERDAAAAAGLTDRVARYDEAIANWNQQYDISGNPIRRNAGSAPEDEAGARELSQADQQALTWARANAGDDRAKAILKRLGVQ